MMNKLLVLLAIILVYLLVVFMFYPKVESMATLDDGNDSDDQLFHGEFGTVKVKTADNGDRVIVAVKPNYKSYSTRQHILYGAKKQTITIYKTDNGKYAVVDENSIDQVGPNQKKVITYYGNTGSVTIRRNSDGTKAIINFQTNMVVDDTSINTFYGPDGNSVDIVRTPDGNLKIVTDSIHTKKSDKVSEEEDEDSDEEKDEESEEEEEEEDEEDEADDFIRKSQIVPPVCPACPSVTSCAKVNKKDEDADTDEEDDDYTNTNASSSTNNQSQSQKKQAQSQQQQAQSQQQQQQQQQAQSQQQQAQSQQQQGPSRQQQSSMVNKGKQSVKSNETQNTIRGPRGNSLQTDGKVGMYLGDNSINQEPMPILNNFSTFA